MADKELRDAVQPLLQDVGESEHRMRRQDAFVALCEHVGLVVTPSVSGWKVRTPEQVEADGAAAKAAQEAAEKAEAEKAEAANPGRTTVPVSQARKDKRG